MSQEKANLEEMMTLDESVDIQEIVAKYDKESATRKLSPLLTKLTTVMLFVWGAWQLYTAFFGEWPSQLQRVTHLGFVLPLVFLLYPASDKLRKTSLERPSAMTKTDVLKFGILCLAAVVSVVINKVYYEGFVGDVSLADFIIAAFTVIIFTLTVLKALRLPVFVFDVILAILGAGVAIYYHVNYEGLMFRDMAYFKSDIIVAAIAILVVLEAARRVLGLPILIVVVSFLLYAYFGKMMPGFLRHRGVRFERLTSAMFFTTEGILGVPLGVSATFIFLFITFGSFLEKTGIGKFFIDLGNAIAGSASGGPAKVAVITSAFEGTISGSSVANTAGSGSFTIPMMKRLGYRPEFAGAVEASASTGGQIMPPVMGAAAFLMCEFLGVPYATIAKAAVIPALLYFMGVFLGVHFEARKQGLKGMPKEMLPRLSTVMLTQGQLLVPIFGIIFFLSMGISAMRAALLGVVLSVLAGSTNRDYRINWKEVGKWESPSFRLFTGMVIAVASGVYVANVFLKLPVLELVLVSLLPLAVYFGAVYLLGSTKAQSNLADFLMKYASLLMPLIEFVVVYLCYGNLVNAGIMAVIAFFFVHALKGEPQIHFTQLLQAVIDGAKGALGVGVACAAAGMIVGVVTMTGLGLKLGTGLVEMANNELLLTMFYTMITSIILGMGVPTTANYVITSTIAAPAIITLIGSGQALAAHLFVFYFGIIADVTPPVALAAFTGAGIAHANPMKTGMEATKLSIAAWLVPYCFVYNTNLLMVNEGFFSFITMFTLFTAVAGMFFIAIGVQGWWRTLSPWWERILAVIAGLSLIGGSRFFHGLLEIFGKVGNFGAFVTSSKVFLYSMTGEYAVNGFGLLLAAFIWFCQSQRYKIYGKMSISEIIAHKHAK
ncbi:MAG TPA: TRAP transporter permease [Bacillota bacterium]|nr:MAG: DctM-like transporter [Firmicutes bacterium ADurb.Bin153]HNV34031.1 TRAP transporter permease [Bacillota bacterium]